MPNPFPPPHPRPLFNLPTLPSDDGHFNRSKHVLLQAFNKKHGSAQCRMSITKEDALGIEPEIIRVSPSVTTAHTGVRVTCLEPIFAAQTTFLLPPSPPGKRRRQRSKKGASIALLAALHVA